MNFKCKHCKKIRKYDMRLKLHRHNLTPKGYIRSYCTETGINALLKPCK